MTLSTKGRYSLEALLFLAVSGKEESGTAISDATGIPLGYLAQLMMPLRKAGIVTARRGADGGYLLANPEVTPREVLEASEGGLHLPCKECTFQSECSTEGFWAEVQKTVDLVTGSVTLQTLAEDLRTMTVGVGL